MTTQAQLVKAETARLHGAPASVVATMRGHTLAVTVTYAVDEATGWVSPEADLEDIFEFTNEDGERLRFKGWLCEVNPIED